MWKIVSGICNMVQKLMSMDANNASMKKTNESQTIGPTTWEVLNRLQNDQELIFDII